MPRVEEYDPIRFEPIFVERIWGGQKLAALYHKNIPGNRLIGESWEIVDRAEAQSIAQTGAVKGKSLHDLWVNFRTEVFGEVSDAPRFPLLIKLLDCREKLSLQVHPPAQVAARIGGEAKTECWYVVEASPGAELYLGFRQPITSEPFRDAIFRGTVAELIHRVPVNTGDAFLIPSGRIHAIGGGNLIVEVQQNSDTTFRVFDWDRKDEVGESRELHVDEAMSCIDFNDCGTKLLPRQGERIVSNELFAMEQWDLHASREIASAGMFAIVFCLSGSIKCAGAQFHPGDFFLLPAAARIRVVQPAEQNSSLLRITIPKK
jgi:mannose-6-phosphate isomerase